MKKVSKSVKTWKKVPRLLKTKKSKCDKLVNKGHKNKKRGKNKVKGSWKK